jgi:serine/threonine-protein kinase
MADTRPDGSGDDGLDGSAELDAALRAVFVHRPRPGGGVLGSLDLPRGVSSRLRLTGSEKLGGQEIATHSHYSFREEIGRGGVGVVVRGLDVDLGREVALKVLRPEYVHHPQALARFVEEAQIEGQLQHPSIVPVYELGLQADGCPFFAMKLVKGQTLAAVYQARESPAKDRRRHLGIFEQICQALAFAHAHGVIHRDLKPANILVGSFGEVQVVDWGFSKVLGREESELQVRTVRSQAPDPDAISLPGVVMGTPEYMPPEQARGCTAEVDTRSDVFALGAILLELLTGLPPYTGERPENLLRAARGDLDEAYRRLASCDADAELKALCRTCLAREKDDRPADARALAARVADHLSAVEERARHAELEAAESRVRIQAERKVRRMALAFAAAVLIAVLTGSGALLWRQAERRARGEEASRVVASAEGEARQLWGEARRSPPGYCEPWDKALLAARRAREVAETGGAPATIRDSTRNLLSALQTERLRAMDTARRQAVDDEMLATLEGLRAARGALLDYLDAEARYLAAFRGYGIDPESDDTWAAAQVIRSSRISGELCAALDEWTEIRARYDGTMSGKSRKLLRLANAADPDEWRTRVRDASAAGDRDCLIHLRSQVDPRRLPPDSALLLARALAAAENREVGILFLRASWAAHPADFWVNYQLGLWLGGLARPDWNEALGHYRAALGAKCDSIEVMFQMGRTLKQLKRHDEAIALFETALSMRPEFRAPHAFLLHSLLEKGELAARLPGLEQEARENPDDAVKQWRLAMSLGNLGRRPEAIEVFRRTVAIEPGFALAHSGLALNLWYEGDLREAEKHMRIAAELEPHKPHWWQNLGAIRGNLGDAPGALAACREALRADPTDPQNHVAVLSGEIGAGEPQRASDTYVEICRRFAGDPVLAQLGFALSRDLPSRRRLLMARQIAGETLKHLRVLVAEAPEAVAGSLWNQIGILQCDILFDFEAAARSFARAIELTTEGDCSPHYNLALAQSRLGLVHEALRSLREYVRLQPDDGKGRYSLAWMLLSNGFVEEALPELGAVIGLDCGETWAYLNRGTALLFLGRPEEGLADLRRYRQSSKWPEGRQVSDAAWEAYVLGLADSASRWPEYEGGRWKPASAREHLAMADLLFQVSRHDLAVGEFALAFEAEPALVEEVCPWHVTYLWSEVAAEAGGEWATGYGGEPVDRKKTDVADARGLARRWLGLALDRWERSLLGEPGPSVEEAALAIVRLGRDPSLAGIREARLLAGLEPLEQEACRALWGRVESLLDRLEDRER